MIKIYLECDDFIIVEKPSGVIVHPWNECSDKDSMLSILKKQTGKWIYPVHRLDRAVSGVMIFAFSSEAASEIKKSWGDSGTEKIYSGLVKGVLTKSTYIDYPLKNQNRTKKQEAKTYLWPIDSNDFV